MFYLRHPRLLKFSLFILTGAKFGTMKDSKGNKIHTIEWHKKW